MKKPGRSGRTRLVHGRQQALRLVELDEPDRAGRAVRSSEGAAIAQEVHPHPQAAEAVAEALVDAALGGPQDRDRLAALMDAVELEPHHPAQDSLAPMGRLDADDRDAGGGQHAAGDRQLEAEDAGRPDDPLAVVGGDRPIGLEGQLPVREVLLAWQLAEGELAGLEEVPRVAAEGADVDLHAPIMARGLLYPSADVPDRRRERARPRAGLRHAGDHRPERPRLPPAPGSRGEPGRCGVHVRLQRRPVRDRQRRRPGRPAADHDRRPDRRGAAGTRAESDLADAVLEHVHARRLAPSRRQHALPVGLRRQRRAPHRPRPVPRLLRPRRA